MEFTYQLLLCFMFPVLCTCNVPVWLQHLKKLCHTLLSSNRANTLHLHIWTWIWIQYSLALQPCNVWHSPFKGALTPNFGGKRQIVRVNCGCNFILNHIKLYIFWKYIHWTINYPILSHNQSYTELHGHGGVTAIYTSLKLSYLAPQHFLWISL